MVCIVQIDTPYLNKIFTPAASGLWRGDLSGMANPFYVGDVRGYFTDIPGVETTEIGSIRVGLDYYDRVETVEECFAAPGTYVYLPDEYAFIVNVEYQGKGWNVPWGKRLEIGLVTCYSTGVDYSREDEAYYNDRYADPRVISIPDFSSKRDRTFFGVNAYTTLDIELNNHDGKLDTIDMSGNVARVYIAESGREYTESDLVQKGFVTKYNKSWKRVQLTIGDKRRTLDTKIDLGRITKVDYPFLDDDTAKENKIIPIPIGDIENYVPICVDKENHNAETASYILGKSLLKYQPSSPTSVWVYEEDGETKQDITSFAYDKTTGLLSVPRASVCTVDTSGDEPTYDWKDLHVSYRGWANSTTGEDPYFCGVDLARIAIETFKGEEFLEFNVDLNSYAREREKSKKIPRKYSILINDDMTINEYLKKVSEASDMVVTCRGDGRYAFRVRYGSPPPPRVEITAEQLIGRDSSGETTNLSEVVAAVEVEYGKAGNSDNKKTYADTSRREYIEQMYHISPDAGTITTILADELSATDKAITMLDNSETPPVETTRTVPITAELSHIDTVDTVIVPTGRGKARIIGEVSQVKKSIGKNQLTWTLIKQSDVKYEADYTQGNVYGRVVFGKHTYGDTNREAE